MRSRAHTLAALLVAIALVPAPARAEFCGSVGLQATVVSGEGLVLPGDGGVLVAAMPGNGFNNLDQADQPFWHYVTGAEKSTPRRVTLAPGLVVYHPRLDGTLKLVDHNDVVKATTFATRRARALLPAPIVQWVVRPENQVNISLGLDKVPPDSAIAIVLVGKNGKARSWHSLDEGTTQQRVYVQIGCQMMPAGTEQSAVGDEVTLFFVDEFGRASPPSKPIKITDKTPSERAISHETR